VEEWMMTTTIQFSNGKTIGEQMARALHKITLREDLTKINEWMGTITFLSGIQTRASDKIIVDSLEGIIIWEYDSLACLQINCSDETILNYSCVQVSDY
jgi:hypothetical protein